MKVTSKNQIILLLPVNSFLRILIKDISHRKKKTIAKKIIIIKKEVIT